MLQTTATAPRARRKFRERFPTPPKLSPTAEAAVKLWLETRFERGRIEDLFSEVITITPDIASYVLDNLNTTNRPVTLNRVQEFVDIIREDRWRVCSQGISFTKSGKLSNGQHRLYAIAVTGIPVKMMVFFGEANDAFKVIDTHKKRGGSDLLGILGEQNTGVVSGIYRLLYRIEYGLNNKTVSNDLVFDMRSEHPTVPASVAPATSLHREAGCVSKIGAGAAHYLITEKTAFPHLVDDFWDKMCTGVDMGDVRDPILKLRKLLISKKKLGTCGSIAPNLAGAIILAWNAHVTKKSPVTLIWDHERPFPSPL